jgi:prepilin-type N-terminal cleavage/methylation domain-containing protein
MPLLEHRKSRRPQRNSGVTLIEVTATLAMLAVAAGAVAKLAAIQSRLSRQHDVRLVATLQTQNTVERLQNVSYEDLSTVVSKLESDSAYKDIRFNLNPFDVADSKGLHLRIDAVDASDASRILASENLWRIQSNQGVSDASE